jgi:hypothetical protein
MNGRAFTKANAREMNAKSHAAKLAKKQAILDAMSTPDFVPRTQPKTENPYELLAMRLLRVRKQLNRVDRLLDAETDPMKIDRLASALLRLSEQERILANRPLPGSRRPLPDRKTPRSEVQVQSFSILPDPAPAPTSTPASSDPAAV